MFKVRFEKSEKMDKLEKMERDLLETKKRYRVTVHQQLADVEILMGKISKTVAQISSVVSSKTLSKQCVDAHALIEKSRDILQGEIAGK